MTWTPTASLKGADGAPGANGRQIELYDNGTYIQWRYVGDATWINLVALADITGPRGPQGLPGTGGTGTGGGSFASTFRGDWDASTDYVAGDIVVHEGSSWLFLEDVAGGSSGAPTITVPGNDPDTALEIGGTGSYGPFNDSGYGGWFQPPINFQWPAFFKFTATSATPVTFTTVGSNGDTEIVYYDHKPFPTDTARTGMDDDGAGNNAATVTFTPTPGTTYYVVTSRYNTGDHSTKLNWTGLPPVPAAGGGGTGIFPIDSLAVIAEAGQDGAAGPAGPAGATGATGPVGPKGDAGAAGPAGDVGPQGPAGATGGAGPIGPQGPKGDTGDPGPIGPIGPQGPQGIQGEAGPTGPTGATGAKGDPGATGAQGIQGVQGVQGDIGPAGLTWRGGWVSGANYLVNDAVSINGASYRRLVAGAGTATPDLDPVNWFPIALKGATGADGATGATGPAGLTWKGAWGAAVAYVVRDAVTYQGSSYRRLVAGTTSTTPDLDSTNWQLLASKGDVGATGATGSTGATGPAGLTWRGTWVSGAGYLVNDAIYYNGSSYRRLVLGAGTTTPDLDTTNWAVLAAKGADGTGTGGSGGSPTGAAGGDLTGTYPNPTVLKRFVPTDFRSGAGLYVGTTAPAAPNDGDVWVGPNDNSEASLQTASIPETTGAVVVPLAFAVTPGVYRLDLYAFWSSLNSTSKSYVYTLVNSAGAAVGKGFVSRTYKLAGGATTDTSSATWTAIAANGSLQLFSVGVATVTTFTQNLEALIAVTAAGTLTLNVTVPAGMTLNAGSSVMLRRMGN